MRALDISSLTLAILGAYAVLLSPRFLLPYYVIPHIEVQLGQTEERLNEAEDVNAIPSESEYRDRFTSLHNQFSQMRTTSNQSPRFLQQLQLMSLSCLTYKLYTLSSQIRALHRRIVMAMDEHRLASAASNQSITATASHARAAITASPTVNVTELTPLPPAARSRLTYPSQLTRVSHMAMDEYQLASIASNQGAITAAQRGPAAITTTPTVAEPTPPPPAARGRVTYPSQLMRPSQVEMDERQLASTASDESATATALPAPAAITAASAFGIAEVTDPILAART